MLCDLIVRAALKQLGVVSKETFIGIYSINRPEWIITEHASYYVK